MTRSCVKKATSVHGGGLMPWHRAALAERDVVLRRPPFPAYCARRRGRGRSASLAFASGNF